MKEFNFKMLHGILSCGANLHKWKIRNSSVCDVCDQDQTIIHLLFECKHVERLWTSVGEVLRHILSPLHNLSPATNCTYVGSTFRRPHAQFDAWRQNVLQWYIRFWGDKMCRVSLHILSSLIGWT